MSTHQEMSSMKRREALAVQWGPWLVLLLWALPNCGGGDAAEDSSASGGPSSGGSSTATGGNGAGGSAAGGAATGSGGSGGQGTASSAGGVLGLGGSLDDGVTECNDGVDNDGDGTVDWQRDPGCFGPQDATESSGTRAEEAGFTTWEFGDDSVVVHVSNGGDDANDGSTPELAVATLTRGAELVRDGENDFLLLRRGDVWRDEALGRFKSGRDARHPLVIGSYGDSVELPRIEVADKFIDHNGQDRSFVALVDLHFVSYPGVPDDPAFTGAGGTILRYVGSGSDLLIEGCHFEYGEVVIQSYGDNPDTPEPDDAHYTNVEVRASVIEKAYHSDTCSDSPEGSATHRPSGIYSSHVHGLLLEGNLLDHNGWNEDVPTACATIYNHNVYLNADDLVIVNNVFSRASSMHIKLRSDVTDDMTGTVIDNNYFVEGEIGVSIGGNSDEPRRFVSSEIRNNVMSDIGRSQPTTRTLGWGVEVQDNDGLLIEDNHFLNSRTPAVNNTYAVQISNTEQDEVTVQRNLFYRIRGRALRAMGSAGQTAMSILENTFVDPDQGACLIQHSGDFGGYTYDGNRYYGSASEDSWFCGDGGGSLAAWATTSGEANAEGIALPEYADPDRDIASYAATLGLDAALPAYLLEARGQSRLHFRPELGAAAINDYIRAGFEED